MSLFLAAVDKCEAPHEPSYSPRSECPDNLSQKMLDMERKKNRDLRLQIKRRESVATLQRRREEKEAASRKAAAEVEGARIAANMAVNEAERLRRQVPVEVPVDEHLPRAEHLAKRHLTLSTKTETTYKEIESKIATNDISKLTFVERLLIEKQRHKKHPTKLSRSVAEMYPEFEVRNTQAGHVTKIRLSTAAEEGQRRRERRREELMCIQKEDDAEKRQEMEQWQAIEEKRHLVVQELAAKRKRDNDLAKQQQEEKKSLTHKVHPVDVLRSGIASELIAERVEEQEEAAMAECKFSDALDKYLEVEREAFRDKDLTSRHHTTMKLLNR